MPLPNERIGYTFVGWYNGETKYESGIWQGTSNITLTAQWELNESEGLTFQLNGDSSGYICTGIGTFTGEHLVIPSQYNNLPVISIADGAFELCENITYAIIPSSVTSVGEYSFYRCVNLAEVEIPDSVTSIGDSAFAECTSLISFTVPSNLTSISPYMLNRCTSLLRIEMSDGVESIGDYAFFGCTNVKDITISDTVTNIGKYALYGCKKLESLTLPFVGATKDGTENTHFGYIFGASTYVENNEFVPASLKNVVVTSADKIDAYAFAKCESLQSVTLPDSVTTIEPFVFFGCTNLMEVNLGDSVTTIGQVAFGSCSNLLSITISSTMKYIDALAFDSCFKLVEIYNLSDLDIQVGSENHGYIGYFANKVYDNVPAESNFVVQDDYVFYKYDNQYHLINYIGQDKDIVLPSEINGNVYDIYKYAFYNKLDLTSVVVPEGVTSIGQYAFAYCRDLADITIPNSVVSIDGYAFFYCKSLTSVTIADGVESIGECAFYDCTALNSIVIGANVSSIGQKAFRGCSGLTEVYYKGTEEQWNKISIESNNSPLEDATRYYYSETNPFEGEQPVAGGNYWHYVDGAVAIWKKN